MAVTMEDTYQDWIIKQERTVRYHHGPITRWVQALMCSNTVSSGTFPYSFLRTIPNDCIRPAMFFLLQKMKDRPGNRFRLILQQMINQDRHQAEVRSPRII